MDCSWQVHLPVVLSHLVIQTASCETQHSSDLEQRPKITAGRLCCFFQHYTLNPTSWFSDFTADHNELSLSPAAPSLMKCPLTFTVISVFSGEAGKNVWKFFLVQKFPLKVVQHATDLKQIRNRDCTKAFHIYNLQVFL